jgi:hypothetical protein
MRRCVGSQTTDVPGEHRGGLTRILIVKADEDAGVQLC